MPVFDPNNAAHTQAAKDLFSAMQNKVNSGDEAGARSLYNQNKAAYGFTDAQFAPYAGGFSAQNVSDFSNNIGAGDAKQAGYQAAQGTQAGYQSANSANPYTATLSSNLGLGATNYANNDYLGKTSAQANGAPQVTSDRNALLGQNNGYLNSAISQAQDDTVRKYNLATRPAEDARMAASGSFGNTGLQQMQNESQRNLAGELGNISNSMRMQDYNLQAQLGEGQAGRSLSASGANASNAMGNNQFNASLGAGDLNRNASLAGQTNMFNAGQGNQANQFSANLGMSNNQFNAGAQNNANQYNNAQANNMNQFNTGQYNANQQYNANLGLQNNQYNAGQYNANQQYNTGQRNSYDLGMSNLDSNNAQFGANYGLNLANSQNNWANNNALTANQIAQTPITQYNNFANNANQTAGMGGTTSQTNQGNPWMTGLGGLQLASSLYK